MKRSAQNNILTCLLIEDEPLALRQMSKYIAGRDELRLIGSASNLEDIGSICSALEKTSVLFLDIMVTGGSVENLIPFLHSELVIVVISALPREQYPKFIQRYAEYTLKKPITAFQFDLCVESILKSKENV